MPNYRRNRVTGGAYFFTVNLLDCRPTLLVTRVDLRRAFVRRTRDLMPFHIDAWIVLLDHMQTVWALPEGGGDSNFSHPWQAFKMTFSKGIDPAESLSDSRRVRGERDIWQRRFWEHTICDERDYASHLAYIHFNPGKHGVAPAAAWPYSSFHRAVAQGQYPSSWTAESIDEIVKIER